MALTERISFLGGGVMANAILRSLLSSGLIAPEQAAVSDPAEPGRANAVSLGAKATASNPEAAASADVVILAVKPHFIAAVLSEVSPTLRPEQLVVSIGAGVTLAQLEALAPQNPVIRVMPNTPVQVGAGAVAFSRGSRATSDHAALVEQLFNAGGICLEVTEPQLDAVTGLSGSGPAYVCLIIEALADGGVRMGLPRPTALKLAAQTLLGGAKLVLETGEHPAALKDRVATPGGTTIAGLAALEEGRVRSSLIKAVEAATVRARELGKA
jgi:pyrroline-5-carboxylate reductase